MLKKFYRVVHDPRVTDGWFPGFPFAEDGTQIDGRVFTKGLHCADPGNLSLPVERQGRLLDFTLAAFDMPVLTTRWAALLEEHVPSGTIQRFPVRVGERENECEIVNVARTVDCLDEQRSSVSYLPSDRRKPTSGPYGWVIDLTLDPSRIGSESLFRVKNWPIALIVSEDLREVLQDARGISFLPVS
jgi:hypothetical protein